MRKRWAWAALACTAALAAGIACVVSRPSGAPAALAIALPAASQPDVTATFEYRLGERVYAHYDPRRVHAPWVLNVHGGYWRFGSGNSAAINAWARYEESRGYQVFALDYRLSTVARWPAQLDDVDAALRWLRAHAADLGLDPDRGALVGASAGGQLAAIAGMGGGVRGVVDWDGAVDPVAALAAPNRKLGQAAEQLLGCSLAECPARWRSAEAQNHIGPLTPPFLIVHTVDDPIVPASMSRALYRDLRAAGVPAALYLAPGDEHASADLPGVLARTDAFLDRVTAPSAV